MADAIAVEALQRIAALVNDDDAANIAREALDRIAAAGGNKKRALEFEISHIDPSRVAVVHVEVGDLPALASVDYLQGAIKALKDAGLPDGTIIAPMRNGVPTVKDWSEEQMLDHGWRKQGSRLSTAVDALGTIVARERGTKGRGHVRRLGAGRSDVVTTPIGEALDEFDGAYQGMKRGG